MCLTLLSINAVHNAAHLNLLMVCNECHVHSSSFPLQNMLLYLQSLAHIIDSTGSQSPYLMFITCEACEHANATQLRL